MKLSQFLLLACLLLAGVGCIRITVPDPPDIRIRGEVKGDGAEGQAEASGQDRNVEEDDDD